MQEFVEEHDQDATVSTNCTERTVRQRMLKKGVIAYGNGAITVECLVRNMSSGGARLKLVNDVPVPNAFILQIPLDGVSVNSVVRWREGNLLGIAFVGDIVFAEGAKRQVVTPTFSR